MWSLWWFKRIYHRISVMVVADNMVSIQRPYFCNYDADCFLGGRVRWGGGVGWGGGVVIQTLCEPLNLRALKGLLVTWKDLTEISLPCGTAMEYKKGWCFRVDIFLQEQHWYLPSYRFVRVSKHWRLRRKWLPNLWHVGAIFCQIQKNRTECFRLKWYITKIIN